MNLWKNTFANNLFWPAGKTKRSTAEKGSKCRYDIMDSWH